MRGEASASRNEVPKSPQSARERPIIAKVRTPLSYLFRRSREGDSDLRCVRNTHKYTRYHDEMETRMWAYDDAAAAVVADPTYVGIKFAWPNEPRSHFIRGGISRDGTPISVSLIQIIIGRSLKVQM